MNAQLLSTLPLAQRLALSYAPACARDATLALLALDTRLAGIVRGHGEPVIAQLKLAWWRDRLAQDPAVWPAGEPLLALMRTCGVEPVRLAGMVDGWELLLSEELGRPELEEFAEGRALGWSGLAEAFHVGAPYAAVSTIATAWALADLALHLGGGEVAASAREIALALPRGDERLPRELRTLVVLHGLARRALLRGSREPLDGPAAMLAAARLGFAGR
ncbi:hypothetical protein GRI62_05840 [Erythrobacter arachoides]|uniref:Phytoene synthase n=1 Tax=Aurantiacibacter arachoides TaxID=1850444 RepID=A0A845A2E5_9SPHN|nr:squalene/phytoene synthase family protein [Aurantiacibacter arachoides]MXO93127.1 hypothetical protein [Aurantiacibacter arachoides]GGD51829.1 hypothetical protein GCM10011411_09580 [Aurantiacibacter arachoides]